MDARDRVTVNRMRVAILFYGALANATLLLGPALATELTNRFSYDSQQIGTYFSLEFAGFVLAGLIGHFVMPRYNWRRVALASALLFALGSFVTIQLLPNFFNLAIARLLTASAGAVLNMVCLASANEDPHPSRAYSLFILGQLVTGVIGLALLPVLFKMAGPGILFAAVGCLALAGIPLIRRFPTDGRQRIAEFGEVADSVSIGRSNRGALIASMLAITTFYMGVGGLWTFAGQLATIAGLTPEASGMALSVATVAGILGVSTAAMLSKGIDIRLPINIGYGLLSLSALLFMALGHVISFFIGAILFKFCWTFVIPFVFTVTGKLVKEGRAGAVVNFSAGIGLALGPQLAGTIAQSAGYFSMLGMELTIILMSGLLAGWISRQGTGNLGKRQFA